MFTLFSNTSNTTIVSNPQLDDDRYSLYIVGGFLGFCLLCICCDRIGSILRAIPTLPIPTGAYDVELYPDDEDLLKYVEVPENFEPTINMLVINRDIASHEERKTTVLRN